MANYDINRYYEEYRKYAQTHTGEFHEPRGNSKLGGIPAFNLLPLVTCTAESCKHCGVEGCYALKNVLRAGYNPEKNTTFRAWADNTILATTNLEQYEADIRRWLDAHRMTVKFARIHGSGEFLHIEHGKMWYRIAKDYPDIKFLAFTKRWSVARAVPFDELPNFELVLSGWTGMTIPEDLKKRYRCAHCVEKGCTPPEGALECPGSCESCGMCWNLSEIGRDTYFHKH